MVRQKGVAPDLDEVFKRFPVELSAGKMDRGEAIDVLGVGVRASVLEHGLDNVLVTPQYCLIQRHFAARVHAGLPLLEDVAEDGEVLVSTSGQQVINEILLVQQYVHIVVVVRQQDPGGLHVRCLTSQMEGRRDDVLRFGALHGLELSDVLELASADVDGLDGVAWEAGQDLGSIPLNSHGVGPFQLEVEALRVAKILDGALRVVPLHHLHKQKGLDMFLLVGLVDVVKLPFVGPDHLGLRFVSNFASSV